MGYTLIPVEHLAAVAEWVRVDYDYDSKTSTRNWKLANDNTFNVELVSQEWLTALQVANKLEN